MGGDKIVLLDGAGANGGGAATNGLLSMIPGMFANLIGGNKMDPNLVAALKNLLNCLGMKQMSFNLFREMLLCSVNRNVFSKHSIISSL